MIKKLLILFVFAGVATTANAQIKTPQPSPHAKLEQVVGLTTITVEYSRPSMKGRVIFGNLVPYGEVWRTGANENTTITFSDNVLVNGQELKKGTYAVYTIPQENSWDVIFYSAYNNWGNPQNWDEANVAAKVSTEVNHNDFDTETFSISFEDLQSGSAILAFNWENVYAGVTIEVPTDKTTMKSIESVMAGPSKNDYFQAATYYHTEGKDLKQALAWMKKAVEGENPPFYYLRRMSLIQADMGDKAGAIATAKKSLESAEKAGNSDYVKMNKESLKQWQQ